MFKPMALLLIETKRPGQQLMLSTSLCFGGVAMPNFKPLCSGGMQERWSLAMEGLQQLWNAHKSK